MMTEAILVRLGIDAKDFNAKLQGARRGVNAFSRSMNAIGIGFGVAAFTRALSSIVNKVEEIGDKAKAVGVSTDYFQGFTLGARRAGLALEDAESALSKLNIKLGEAQFGGAALDDFDKWGVAIFDASGKFIGLEKVVDNIAQAMAGVSDTSQRARMAVDLMGKGAQNLAPMFEEGAEGLRKFREAAKGQVISSETIDSISQAKQELEELGDILTKYAADALTTSAFAGLFQKLGEGFAGGTGAGKLKWSDLSDNGGKAAKNELASAMRSAARHAKENANQNKTNLALQKQAQDIENHRVKVADILSGATDGTISSQEKLNRLQCEFLQMQDILERGGLKGADVRAHEVKMAEKKADIIKQETAIKKESLKKTEDEIGLEKRKLELARETGDKSGELKARKAIQALIKEQLALMKQLGQQADINAMKANAELDAKAAAADLDRAKKDRSKITLQELTEAPVIQRRGFGGGIMGNLARAIGMRDPNQDLIDAQQRAFRIQRLDELGMSTRGLQGGAVSQRFFGMSDKLREGLDPKIISEQDRKPFLAMENTAKNTKALVDAMNSGGVPVMPVYATRQPRKAQGK